MAKLIMLVGLPGSGKSTYGKKLCASERVTAYLSSDKIREELYGDESIQGDPNKVFRIMHDRLKNHLKEGHVVVYDATNVTRKNRKAVLDEVKHLCGEGVEAHIVWAPYFQCIERDKQRKRTVGEDVIRKFLYRWQSPFYDEGFDTIKIIYNCDVGWDRVRYNNAMLENMKIPHDNPHHKLNIQEHCASAESYCFNKWPTDCALIEAAAFHDIGKPFTKGYKTDEAGTMIPVAHYYQHDNVGGYFVYGCYNEPVDCDQRAVLVSWLVCNHMQPYFQSNYYKNLDFSYKVLIDRLHEADVAAH